MPRRGEAQGGTETAIHTSIHYKNIHTPKSAGVKLLSSAIVSLVAVHQGQEVQHDSNWDSTGICVCQDGSVKSDRGNHCSSDHNLGKHSSRLLRSKSHFI